MVPTVDQLIKIAGPRANRDNVNSIVVSLKDFGKAEGLDKPHRLAHFIAQVAHESGGFHYDREVWGPTPAQQRYDTRTDLGNTAAADGDGKKNAGKGPLQVTGGANILEFETWCTKRGYDAPDFSGNPDLINTDPWEGLSAIWFWTTRKLNVLADENNIEQLTKKINGGLNGFPDRILQYVRTALVLLGFEPTDIVGFQRAAQAAGDLPKDEPGKPTQIDNDAGPKTRAALHMTLSRLDTGAIAVATPSPVVSETTVETQVAVAPEPPKRRVAIPAGVLAAGAPLVSSFMAWDLPSKLIFGGIGLIAVVVIFWQGELVIRRIRKVIDEFGEAG